MHNKITVQLLIVSLVLFCRETANGFFQPSRRFEIMDLVGPNRDQQSVTATSGSLFDKPRYTESTYKEPMPYRHRNSGNNMHYDSPPIDSNTMYYNNPAPTSNPMHYGNQAGTDHRNQPYNNDPMHYDPQTVATKPVYYRNQVATTNPVNYHYQSVTTNPMYYSNHGVTTNPIRYGNRGVTPNPTRYDNHLPTTGSFQYGYQTETTNRMYTMNQSRGQRNRHNYYQSNDPSHYGSQTTEGSVMFRNQGYVSRSAYSHSAPARSMNTRIPTIPSNPKTFDYRIIDNNHMGSSNPPVVKSTVTYYNQPADHRQRYSTNPVMEQNPVRYNPRGPDSYHRYSSNQRGGGMYMDSHVRDQNRFYDRHNRHDPVPYRNDYIRNEPVTISSHRQGILDLLGPIGPIRTVMPFNSVTEKITTTTEIPDREKERKPAPRKKKPAATKKKPAAEKKKPAPAKPKVSAKGKATAAKKEMPSMKNLTLTTAKPVTKTTVKPEVETSAYETKGTTDVPEEKEIGEDPTTSVDGLTQRTESPHGTDPIEQHDPVSTVAMPNVTANPVTTTKNFQTQTQSAKNQTKRTETQTQSAQTQTPSAKVPAPTTSAPVLSLTPLPIQSPKVKYIRPTYMNSGSVFSFRQKQAVTPKPMSKTDEYKTLLNEAVMLAKKLAETGKAVKSPGVMLQELTNILTGKQQSKYATASPTANALGEEVKQTSSPLKGKVRRKYPSSYRRQTETDRSNSRYNQHVYRPSYSRSSG